MAVDSANGGEEGTLFDRVARELERNARGVQLGLYAVALGGLAAALRSVRPFARFSHSRQVPAAFFHRHVALSGCVAALEPGLRPLLRVHHAPLLFAGLRKPGPSLGVTLAAIEPSQLGLAWLQTLVVGKDVTLELISPVGDCVAARVCLPGGTDVGARLVALGFASVAPFDRSLDSDRLYRDYYKKLLATEAKAESAGLGMWSDQRPSLMSSITSQAASKLFAPISKLTRRLSLSTS